MQNTAVNTHDATNILSCPLMCSVVHCLLTCVHCSTAAQYSLTCIEYPIYASHLTLLPNFATYPSYLHTLVMIPHMKESNLPNFSPNPLRDELDKLHYEQRCIK